MSQSCVFVSHLENKAIQCFDSRMYRAFLARLLREEKKIVQSMKTNKLVHEVHHRLGDSSADFYDGEMY